MDENKTIRLSDDENKTIRLSDDENKTIRLSDDENKTIRLSDDENKTIRLSDDENKTIRLSDDENKTIRLSDDENKTIRLSDDENKTIRLSDDENKTIRLSDDENKTIRLDVTKNIGTFLNYKIIRDLGYKAGGEADVYIIEYEGKLAFAKLYRANVTVNLEALNKIKRLSSKYDYFPKIYEIGKIKNRVYEIQEYLDGIDLREKLKKNKESVRKNINQFIQRIAEALNILHKEGIIHRDLKPENILYRKNTPVLTDFGALTKFDREMSRQYTNFKGTSTYLAPETVDNRDIGGKKTYINEKVDWWAFGIIILEILDKNPLNGLDSLPISVHLKKTPILSLITTELDEKYQLLLKGLLTKDYKKRWGYKEIKAWLNNEIPKIYYEEKIEEEFDFEFKGAKYTPEQLVLQMITEKNFDDAVKYFDKGFFSEAKIKNEKNPYRAQLLDLFDLKTPEEKVIFFSYTILKTNNKEMPFSLYGIKITDNYIITTLQRYVVKKYLNETEEKIINLMEEGIFKRLVDIYENIYNKKILIIKKFLPDNLNLENAQELLNICNNYFNGNIELVKILLEHIQMPSDCAVELLSNNELYKVIKKVIKNIIENKKENLNIEIYIKGLIANGYIEDVKELVKEPNEEYLKTAFKYHQIEIAKYFLDLGTNPNIFFNTKNSDILTPLIYAVKNNDIEFIKYLLDKEADPNLVPEQQNSPLMQAVVNENKDIINLLLEYNADINLISGINIPRTPLHEAVSINNKEITELLLNKKADPNIKSHDSFPKTPLFTAVENENKEIIELLLKNNNTDPNIMGTINENGYEWTPLFEATTRENKEIIKLLLKYKANPNIKCNTNLSRTPLHEVVVRNKIEIAELLLKHKANPNIVGIANEKGEEITPLHSAIMEQNKEMVELLLKYNADPNIESNTGLTPLYSAVINEDYEIIKLLLKHGAKIDFETARYVQNNNKKLEKLFFEKTIKKTRIKNIIQGTLIIIVSLILFYRILLVHYYPHPNSLFEKQQFHDALLNPNLIANDKLYIFSKLYNSIPSFLKPIIITSLPKEIKNGLSKK